MTLTEGGFITQKLLGEKIGSEAIMSMASPAPPSLGGAYSSSSSLPYDNNASRIQSSSHANIILALFALLFFATFLSAHIQRCYLRHNPGRATIVPYYRHPPTSPPRGLDSVILETLPKVAFSSTMAKKIQAECMICLEEFENEETLQVLPQCGHGFHPECIHMWLFSHTTCPLCRHSLLPLLKPSASSPIMEAAVCDSVGSSSGSGGGVTLMPQHPSTPLQVQISVTAVTISIGGELKSARLRRSHSTGHFPMKEEAAQEEATYSSSSLPPHSFVMRNLHCCKSDTIINMSGAFTTMGNETKLASAGTEGH